jgi:Zn-dependent M16 (insulinase) family peptidase
MAQYMSDRMYDKIRGQGWTYGVSISTSVEDGRMTLSFIRSSNIDNAFEAFRDIITNYTNLGTFSIYSFSSFIDHVSL